MRVFSRNLLVPLPEIPTTAVELDYSTASSLSSKCLRACSYGDAHSRLGREFMTTVGLRSQCGWVEISQCQLNEVGSSSEWNDLAWSFSSMIYREWTKHRVFGKTFANLYGEQRGSDARKSRYHEGENTQTHFHAHKPPNDACNQ